MQRMRDFEVTIRLRNNHLKRRRLELGMISKEFAEAIRIAPGTYAALETMHDSPLTKYGQWRPVAQRIADYHGVPCEELWPEVVLAVERSVITREIDGAALRLLAEPPSDPEQLLMAKEAQQDESMIDDLVVGMPERQRQALVLHLEGNTLEEIGARFGVTKEVARQHEAKACYKIRHRVRFDRSMRERVEAKLGRDIPERYLREG
ncbi:MAG: sigma factor-like helix-turn-helix DNA-binding protein [Candidatus Nanoarchaeia archaeon]|jgi:RNA polymerase sigma factor (sigma-70 family)|nr:sigma factor-like helix-turn-helix DNA-binding protein [Candidatus Nanoarchaeia archaeon]